MLTIFQGSVRLFAIVGLFVVLGCSAEKTAPITDLSEEHKQQLEELNEQRASEWDSKK